MIMTSRALQRVREERFTHAVGDVVKESLSCNSGDFHAREFPWSHAKKSRGDYLFGVIRIDLIPCDLFPDKLIVGFVTIECTNDVVAVPPGVAAFVVVGKTAAVCVPSDIKPVLCHPLAIVRRFEQPVDERRDGRILFVFKCSDER